MDSTNTSLQIKIDDSMEQIFDKYFPGVPYTETIQNFADIAAVWSVYSGMTGGILSEADTEYLEQFENPLEALSGMWNKECLWSDTFEAVECTVALLRGGQTELYGGLNEQGQQMS